MMMKEFAQGFLMFVATAGASVAVWAGEAHYEFRRRLATVHETGLRDGAAVCAADETRIEGDWTIAVPQGATDFIFRAAQDFQDYLAVSMGVDVRIARNQGSGNGDRGRILAIAVDTGMKARSERIEVTADGVKVTASDDHSLAQALYHIEDLMNLRRAPFLKRGVENRERLFAPRMTHSGWACDEFPDPYLAHVAHAGMDAILVYVYDVDSTKGHPQYQDVNDIIRRARKFGIGTYLYSYIHSFAHPDDPGGKEAIENSFGRVSAAYPDAAGLILVGESCEFPSKDPRVIPVAARSRGKEYEGDTRPMAGYFPCNDYHKWLKAVTEAVRRHNPKSDVVFWTYNWGEGKKEAPRMELIDSIQKDVSLMATWEMFERFKLPNGFECGCADYTLAFVGPGRYFSTDAARAKKNGLRLYSQSCTGGITWDYGDVPYMPVPQLWKERWDRTVKAHDDWGLCGIMEGHHMGWQPSFVSELCKEAYVRGGIPFEKHVRAIAARDFGEANAEAVVAAWAKWSEALKYVAPTHANQYGMFRTGPAYPFNALGPRIQHGLGGDGSGDYPHCKYASNGFAIARLNYADDQVRQWVEGLDYFPRMEIPAKELELEVGGLRKAYGLFMDGVAVLRRAADTLEGARRVKAHRVAGLGEFMGRTCRTAVNVKLATADEDVVLSKTASEAEKAAAKDRILKLAKDEYENAKAALPLVDADSNLGWEPTMEYCGGREQIEWKLRRMEENYKEGLK